jgi:hypothetical protein
MTAAVPNQVLIYQDTPNRVVVEDSAPTRIVVNTAFSGSNTRRHVHNQGTASDTWVINHTLGGYPSVTVVDTASTVVIGIICKHVAGAGRLHGALFRLRVFDLRDGLNGN